MSTTSFLWNGAWHVRIAIHSYARREIEVDLALVFGADFADVFEVRGIRRVRRGMLRAPVVEPAAVTLGYDGLDAHARLTRLELSRAPHTITGQHARLPDHARRRIASSIDGVCGVRHRHPCRNTVTFERALACGR